MGFAIVWSNNEAFSIEENDFVKIPKNVRASLCDTQSPFYVIPANIPFGLESRPGKLLVCESFDGGVAIKGWRFDDGEWNIDFLGGGVHLDHHAKLIKIECETSNGGFSDWIPANKEAWRNPGTSRHFARISDSYSLVASDENVRFQDFMDEHWKQAKKCSVGSVV